jgi:hypothetical protein
MFHQRAQSGKALQLRHGGEGFPQKKGEFHP